MVLTADYIGPTGPATTGFIRVTRDGGSAAKMIPTSNFLNIDFNSLVATSFSNNRDDANFTMEQKRLRILDMMKDGKVSKGANISGSVYEIMSQGDPRPPPRDAFPRLGEIENKFDAIMVSKMKPWSWPKISKLSRLAPLLPQKVVNKESGLDAQYFIDAPIFCGDFANEVVDPAGRSPIGPGDIVFPNNDEPLNLTENFFTFFGFSSGCSVEATRRDNGSYTFVIVLPGLTPINAQVTREGTFNIDWFQGNVQKNNFISLGKNGRDPGIPIKRGLLITKEMGDVLQVLIMFLWTLFNLGRPYTMTTCDKVVMLQCILLNLNCVLTSAIKDSGVKLRQIYEFRPITDPRARAVENFVNEKRKIFEQNALFISGFAALKARPDTNIYIAGDAPRTFSSEFYEIIERELTAINEILTALGYAPTDSPAAIDALTERMKKSFLFNLFIRKPTNQLKMTLAKKYTEQDDLWRGRFQSALPNYGRDPFYSIGKTPRFLTSRGGGLLQKGGGQDLDPIEEKLFEFLEYDLTPAWYYDPDIVEQTNPGVPEEDAIFQMVPVDLYTTLNEQIMYFLQQKRLENFFYEFVNELYFKFYLNNAVAYDDELNALIDYIIANDIIIPIQAPPQIQAPPFALAGPEQPGAEVPERQFMKPSEVPYGVQSFIGTELPRQGVFQTGPPLAFQEPQPSITFNQPPQPQKYKGLFSFSDQVLRPSGLSSSSFDISAFGPRPSSLRREGIFSPRNFISDHQRTKRSLSEDFEDGSQEEMDLEDRENNKRLRGSSVKAGGKRRTIKKRRKQKKSAKKRKNKKTRKPKRKVRRTRKNKL